MAFYVIPTKDLEMKEYINWEEYKKEICTAFKYIL